MDRKWMSLDRLKEYEAYRKGVKDFIGFAAQNAGESTKIVCPCLKCCHGKSLTLDEVEDHLLMNGIDEHMHGARHGDIGGGSSYAAVSNHETQEVDVEIDDFDRLEEMTHAFEEELRDCPEMFETLSKDARTPLYKGCTKFTKLSAVLRLFNLKAGNGWSDKSFTQLLELLKDLLPEDNVLPPRTYEAKKMLSSIGLGCEKIHACPNDCILYRKEYSSLVSCPVCKTSRYKRKRVPAKVLFYFPPVPRFRRMFASADDAKNLKWHAQERQWDGKLKHPSDSPQWTLIDNKFPEFGAEARNLRLALATDGMNPHGDQSSSYSTWPVILAIYNLPPWLCMKRKYLMLTMLISGPKQPGNDIDVYLAPLIEDLKMLWEEGVEVYDASENENFTLKAMLFGTINDFPAYGNLAGYSVKGYKACPICDEKTCGPFLKHSNKNVYLGHRRFLPLNHPYRKKKKAFNGHPEEERAPVPLSGVQVLDKMNKLNVTFGKCNAADVPKRGYKKLSSFFELQYWRFLYVRHNLDVMHIEKNICDSLIGTLLNVPRKTKDGLKARKDMVDMKIRKKLAPVKKGQRTYLPPACHTLSRKEKVAFCECLAGVKVPEGHCSNIKNLVSMRQLKLIGLKSHDCHILMQQLLPVAIRSVLPQKVRNAITRLCCFFKAICSKVIDPLKLSPLQKEVVETLCELEMYFPPSFFDIMEHLTVHLVREIQLCGPVFMRYMYAIERYMKVLKGYVKNRSRPEGCMVERHLLEEAIEFCTAYLTDAEAIGLPKPRSSRKTGGKGAEVITISYEMWTQAHLYVLNNTEEVEPYLEEHLTLVEKLNPNRSQKWVRDQHNQCFIDWLRDRVLHELDNSEVKVSERLKWLAIGPRMEVFSYRSYFINSCTFSTKDQDDQSTTQNSGVTLTAEAMHIASAKDKNPVYGKMTYYGVIERIWELDYGKFRLPVFCCKWVDNNNGVRVEDLGFTLVNLNKVASQNEPFILASQPKQVYYVSDPANKHWSVVLSANKRNVIDDPEEDDFGEDSDELPYFSFASNADDFGDQEFDLNPNHVEGIWVRPSKKKSKRLRPSLSRNRKRKR